MRIDPEIDACIVLEKKRNEDPNEGARRGGNSEIDTDMSHYLFFFFLFFFEGMSHYLFVVRTLRIEDLSRRLEQ